jgi:ABC-type phosphate/phosphonate transport system substrate-binding protein
MPAINDQKWREKMKMKVKVIVLAVAALFLMSQAAVAAEVFNVVIMASKNPRKEGPKYKALGEYIKAQSSDISGVEMKIAKDYADAARLFQSGEVDGMFSGSFVAAILIKKGLASPLVRPVSKNGVHTYKALVAAPKGSAKFAGISDFKGKKVAYCSLASSGEVFARTLLNPGEKPEDHYTVVKAKSHGAALNAIKSGAADYAVFKNLIWDPAAYPELEVIGGDEAENPNNTLITSKGATDKFGKGLGMILMNLEKDNSALANKVKEAFGIKGFKETTEADFAHTFSIVEKANIDPATFNFQF